ncbi:MAG: tetratricopeptide repeat protein [Planctomycetota bacterium]|jgi:hypothetical protein
MNQKLILSVALAGLAGLVAWPVPATGQEVAGDTSKQEEWRACQDAYNQARQKRRWEDYRALAQAFAKKYPDHFDVAWQLAISFEMESNKGQAHEWYQKASNIDPDHFLAALESGMGWMRYQQKEKAIPFLERANKALAGGKGTDGNEDAIKLAKYALPGALVEAFWEQGESHKNKKKGQALKDKAIEIAKDAIKAQPAFPGIYYYLGVWSEEQDDREMAINYYMAGLKQKVEGVYAQANHKYGIEDRRREANQRQVYLKGTQVKYGEIKNDGMRFYDAEKDVSVDKPHPKILKLKKGAKHPWDFWFAVSHEVSGNSVNTHIIDVVRRSSNGFDHDVMIRVSGGAHTLNLNTQSGGSVKWDNAEKVAEALETDAVKGQWVDVTNHKKVRKATFGRGMKGFSFSFTGKQKGAVDNYKSNKAAGKRVLEPPVWDVHWWVVKGKKNMFHVLVLTREGMWKKHQKEIQVLLHGIKWP